MLKNIKRFIPSRAVEKPIIETGTFLLKNRKTGEFRVGYIEDYQAHIFAKYTLVRKFHKEDLHEIPEMYEMLDKAPEDY